MTLSRAIEIQQSTNKASIIQDFLESGEELLTPEDQDRVNYHAAKDYFEELKEEGILEEAGSDEYCLAEDGREIFKEKYGSYLDLLERTI